jgi:hypothetical protein
MGVERIARFALAFAAAASACKRSVRLDASPPPDAAYAALLVLGTGGSVRASSPLEAWAAGDPLPIVARASDDAVIVAYTKDQLDRAGVLSLLDPGHPPAVLASVAGCAQRLPAPAWYARWSSADRIEAFTASTAPPLTISGAVLACPDLANAPVAVELPCGTSRCVPVVEHTGACSLSLDLSACGIGRVAATFDADGRACLDFSSTHWACAPGDVVPGARAAYRCTSPQTCDLDLYVDPGSLHPPVTIDRAALFPAAPYLPRLADTTPILVPDGIDSGYAFDLLIIKDRVVVSAVGDMIGRPVCPNGQSAPGKLVFFDLESLAQITTATAPPCLGRLASVPGENVFLSAFIEGGSWHIGRFDAATGRLLARAPGPSATDSALHRILVIGDEAMLMFSESGTGRAGSVLEAYGVERLEHRSTLDLRDRADAVDLTLVDTNTAALVTDDSRQAAWIDLASMAVTIRSLPADASQYRDIYGLIPGVTSGELLVTPGISP